MVDIDGVVGEEPSVAELDELRDTVRSFLDDKAPMRAVREQMELTVGFDRDLWRLMSDQLGLQGIAIPERFGGSGFGWVELGVVFEELGRSLACVPFLASVGMSASALLASGDEEACAAVLPRIAAGTTIAAVALRGDQERSEDAGPQVFAEETDSDWTLSGHASFVIDGADATVLLVFAQTAHGVALFIVDPAVAAVRRNPLSAMDQTRRLARCEFDNAPARLVGEVADGPAILDAVTAHALVVLSAEQVGGAQRCLEMSVAYAKTRYQFGRPIGSFQAVKHTCAAMLVDVELARSTAQYAARATGLADGDELALAAGVAHVVCSKAYTRVANQTIQVHGGIGFTWEHDAHLYLKRAKSAELILGGPAFHQDRVADALGL